MTVVNRETSVIIPAYNEERNLGRVIQNLRSSLSGYDLQIIVVDDGSSDRTTEVAKSEGTFLIRHPVNRGKGAAFRSGIPAIEKEFVVQIDADHQFQPSDIPKLLLELEQGSDIVLGSRFKGGRIETGSVNIVNRFGNWLMSTATSLAAGTKVYDIMAGFKAFRTEALKKLNLQTDHFGYEAEIVVKAGKLGLKIAEVPITYSKRLDGVSNVKTLRDGTLVLMTIAKTYFQKNHQ